MKWRWRWYCDQAISVLVSFKNLVFKCHVSVVYAKCSRAEIIELWNHLISFSQDITGPWVVGGDFNIVSSSHEKAGGSIPESGSHWSYNQGASPKLESPTMECL